MLPERFQRREVLRGGGGIQGRLGEDESDVSCGRRCARLEGSDAKSRFSSSLALQKCFD